MYILGYKENHLNLRYTSIIQSIEMGISVDYMIRNRNKEKIRIAINQNSIIIEKN